MRPGVPTALLALILLIPAAAAQAPLPFEAPKTVDARLAAEAGPVIPYGPPQKVPLEGKVSCAVAAQGAKDGLPVKFVVTKKPAWAQLTVLPVQVLLDPRACDAASQGVPVWANVTAFAATSAPAFQAGDFAIDVVAVGPGGEQKDEVVGTLKVGFYGALDVRADGQVREARPGDSGSFNLTVTNLGNAPVTVEVDARPTEGVSVDRVPPVTLDAAGSPGAKKLVPLTWHAVSAFGRVDRGDPITVKLSATAQADGALRATPTTLELRVNTKSLPQEPMNESPATQVAGTLAALVVAGLVLARRR